MSIITRKYIGWGATALLICAMMAAASLFGEREIIFPEILALAAGAWAAPKQPWRVSRVQTVLLMSIAAVFGVCVVRFLPVPQLLQAAVAFIFVAVILLLTKTTLVPMVSAAVLPVLLGTTSWVYPASVLVLSFIIAAFRHTIKGKEASGKSSPSPMEWNFRQEALRWLALLLCFCAAAFVPVQTGNLYFIAPPLIVMFCELSKPQGAPRRHMGAVFGLMAMASVTGVLVRYVTELWLGLPIWMTGGFCAVILLLMFARVKMIFPPAGAAMLLPMLLPADKLWLYPPELITGCLVFMGLSCLLFRDKKMRAASKEPVGGIAEEG